MTDTIVVGIHPVDVAGITYADGQHLVTEPLTVTATDGAVVVAVHHGSHAIQGDDKSTVLATGGTVTLIDKGDFSPRGHESHGMFIDGGAII